jgi:peptide/nickel transport system permease protein
MPDAPSSPLLQPAEVDTATVAGVPIESAAVAAVEVSAQKRLGVGGVLAIGWIVFVVLAALLAPVLPLDDPNASVDFAREGPSADHWFGTDGIGRDLFSRVIWGGRMSLLVGTSAVVLGLVIGGLLGLVAGYFRGRLESVLVGLFDVMLAIPQLVFALALVAVLANDFDVSSSRRTVVLIVSLGIVSIPILARITRANTLTWSQREFVLAGRAMGARNRRILVRDVLPNVLPAMFSITLLGIAVVIVAEGGLSLLGVGVLLPTPSWGNIISEGRDSLNLGAAHIIIFAALFIFLTVLALNYLGDVVRARFDVRESAL